MINIKGIGVAALIVSLGVGGVYLYEKHRNGGAEIAQPLPNVKVVTIAGPITEKIVTQYITDPAQAKLAGDLLAENKRLKIQVGTLTSTIALLDEKGGVGINGGTITESNDLSATNATPESPKNLSFSFKDFQLDAAYTSDGKRFSYDLKQGFNIVTTTGVRKDGSKLSIVKLYQDVSGKKVEVSSVTTEIQTLDNPVKWWISPRIQGGFGYVGQKSGVVALQWLKRGRSVAAEDTTFALLSPGVTVGAGGSSLTILPISFNLGGLKHSPFTNLWVSPTVNLDKNVGVAITATF